MKYIIECELVFTEEFYIDEKKIDGVIRIKSFERTNPISSGVDVAQLIDDIFDSLTNPAKIIDISIKEDPDIELGIDQNIFY